MKIDIFATDLIKDFFEKLNQVNIKYAVLRNYESLPEANSSKDVDIVISPQKLKQVVSLLKQVAKKNAYQLIWTNKLDYLEGFVFVKIDNDNIYSVKLDLFDGFKWRGCSYINHNMILDSAVDYNGFKVPTKAHEAFIMVVYYVLYAKTIKTKYLEPIYINATQNIEEFKKITKAMFPPKLSTQIIDLIEENKVIELVSLRKEIRSSVVNYNVKNEVIVRNFLKHLKTEYWNRNSFGTMIAFSGPDGAGKSTLVDAIMELLYSFDINGDTVPHHLLTKNIPSLHKLPGAPKKYAKQDYTKPYQAKTAGFLSSTIRTAYYYFAFLIDRLLYIKKELRNNKIVIFDRYYTDIIADPVRIRIGLNKSLVQKIFGTLPSPNFTFVILADKEKILNRKDELKEDKLVELLSAYESLPNSVPNCKVLYNNASVDEGKLMICQNVFDRLEERYL